MHKNREEQPGGTSTQIGRKADGFFSAALAARRNLFDGPPSIIKVQVLLSMLARLYLNTQN